MTVSAPDILSALANQHGTQQAVLDQIKALKKHKHPPKIKKDPTNTNEGPVLTLHAVDEANVFRAVTFVLRVGAAIYLQPRGLLSAGDDDDVFFAEGMWRR